MKIADEYKVYTEEEKKKVILYIKKIFKVLSVAIEYCIVVMQSLFSIQVITAGGLHVVGTERHESRRIDNQVI